MYLEGRKEGQTKKKREKTTTKGYVNQIHASINQWSTQTTAPNRFSFDLVKKLWMSQKAIPDTQLIIQTKIKMK
jgi:hypothetical protein